METIKRLSESAQTGNVGELHQLLGQNPSILADLSLISPHESLLHIASKSNHLTFVQEVLKHKPELANESTQDGFRPLDIASALGHLTIVKELLKTGPEICRLAGRDGRAAIHYAALNDRVAVIDELVTSNKECMKDLTDLGETAFHLAVKCYKFEALRRLINWAEKLGMEEVMNWCDRDRNTVMHVAVSRKQLQAVELLVSKSKSFGGSLELNAVNSRVLTAMDILDLVTESPADLHLRDVLQLAGALRAQDIQPNMAPPPPSHPVPNRTQTNQGILAEPSKDWFKYFKFQAHRDSPGDARNVLLVVAALIATVTFQAGVNPPSGFSPRDCQNVSTSLPPPPPPPLPPPPLPTPLPPPSYAVPVTTGIISLFGIVASLAPSAWFVFGNTLGLSTSLSIIGYLTAGFPFQREIQISLYSMMFAYGLSIQDIEPHGAAKYVLFGIASALPFLLRWPPRWAMKAWKSWRKGSVGNQAG